MNKLFLSNPKTENSSYRIRLVRRKDLNDLLELYSNKENLKLVNTDDCNGDDFYFPTLEEIEKKYQFWKYAYKERWFVRMSIICKQTNKPIGMIELMKIDSYDSYNEDVLLRLDLLLQYEQENVINEIILLIKDKILKECSYKKIVTKATKEMNVRIGALKKIGFKFSNRIFIGKEDNKYYKDYYVRKK